MVLLRLEVHLRLNVCAPEVLFGLSKYSYTKLHAYRNLAHFDGSCNSGISAQASQLGASYVLNDAALLGKFVSQLRVQLVFVAGATAPLIVRLA